MKPDHPIRLYALQMREIKRRMEVIDYFLLAGGHALYKPTTIESICLQVRHILELVALASLMCEQKGVLRGALELCKPLECRIASARPRAIESRLLSCS